METTYKKTKLVALVENSTIKVGSKKIVVETEFDLQFEFPTLYVPSHKIKKEKVAINLNSELVSKVPVELVTEEFVVCEGTCENCCECECDNNQVHEITETFIIVKEIKVGKRKLKDLRVELVVCPEIEVATLTLGYNEVALLNYAVKPTRESQL